jgi:hypothetical protein
MALKLDTTKALDIITEEVLEAARRIVARLRANPSPVVPPVVPPPAAVEVQRPKRGSRQGNHR